MYLSIPKGMKFKQITEGNITSDYFVDPEGVRPNIALQELVKEALRTNNGRSKCINLAQFSIYTRKPPFSSEEFLEYIPNQNGKYATKDEVKLISGISTKKYNPAEYTGPGTVWCSQFYRTEAQLQEIAGARQAQRDNRRHVGDCPLAT